MSATPHLRLVPAGLDQVTDADLLARAQKQDAAAFAIIVDRHLPVVHRVVWRMMNGHADAEDVAQDAFLKLWRDPSQLRDGAALRGWLMRVATNLANDRFRVKPMQTMDEDFEIADNRETADEMLDRSRAVATIDAAVAQLPERQKLALTLVHFEHMSNPAAASVMELSVDALESLLARARRTLKISLAANKVSLLATLSAERT